MTATYSFGFIGFGKMARAMWESAWRSGFFSNSPVFFCEKTPELAALHSKEFHIESLPLHELVHRCDILFFCVKPQQIAEVLDTFPQGDLSAKWFISICAGISIRYFEQRLGTPLHLIRVMPNTPVLLGEGMSVLSYASSVPDAFIQLTRNFFSACGEIEDVSEEFMDIVTGISGSGPAFLYRIAHDIAETGSKKGLPYPIALKLIAQTLVGAGQMLLKSRKTPHDLIQDVSSPGGTTIAGLTEFDKSHIDHEIQSVILKAIERARELGR